MIIRLPLLFEGSKAEKRLYALFDSGATYSCITETFAETLGLPDKLARPMRLATAKEDVFMHIHQAIRLDFYHDDVRMSDEFLVVPSLNEDVIIGAHTMQKWRLKLDFERDTVIVDPRVAQLILSNLIT